MEKVKLINICNLKQWKTIPINKLINTGYPVYGANGKIGFFNEYNHEKETLMITCRGANCGSINISEPFSYINGNSMCLDNLNDNFNLRYLYYFFKNYNFKNIITGSAQPQITIQNLKKIDVVKYDLSKQEKIVKELDCLNEIINMKKQQLNELNELIKSQFIEMFGDPFNNNKNWKKDTLGNYITILTDFSANGSYEYLDSNVKMYDEPQYAIMVRTVDLESEDIFKSAKYITKEAYELLAKSKLYGGELIMNKIGSAGKIYIMPKVDMPASLGRNAFMFKFDDRLNMIFLYNLLTTDYGNKEIQQYVRGAVTKTITKDSTRSIKIIVPPIELQNQFADFVKHIDKLKLKLKESIKQLETLFASRMQTYFGE